MPIITTFMYSEGSTNEITQAGQKLHIVAPLLNLTPYFIPGTMSFTVNMGILGIDVEREHKIQFKFLKADNQNDPPLVDTGEIPFPIINDPQIFELPEDMRGIMLNIGFQNVIFRTEGTYETQVFLNGEKLGAFPIKVRGKERLQ